PEDASAAVGVAVDQDLHELVGGERGHVPEGAVVEGEDVALAAERVVGRADAAAAWDSGGGTGDARLARLGAEAPDVEILLPLLERRSGEEDGDQTPRVLLALAALGPGVAVSEDQEVDLRLRRAGPQQGDEGSGAVRRRVAHRLVLRVHLEGPQRDEGVCPVALLEGHLHRTGREREAERLLEGAGSLPRGLGVLPLAGDGAETTRVEE